MVRLAFTLALLAIAASPAIGQVDPVVPDDFLSSLRPGHPRLMLTDERLADLKAQAALDSDLERMVRQSIAQADDCLGRDDLEHKLIGPRLLHMSRRAMDRTYALGLAWRWTGDEKYARQLEKNLLAVCAFPDWNPSHFLDVAEMSHAVGVGYDWLHGWLSEDSRRAIREGLVRHGLNEGVKGYDGGQWFPGADHNWNQVCNGGLIAGALAVADEEPDIARRIVSEAAKSLPRAMASYAPDGAWPEGPGYWGYATNYTVFGLCALETALGMDFGLSRAEGFSEAAQYPIYASGPTGGSFRFADVGGTHSLQPMACRFWLARRFDDSFVAATEHRLAEQQGASPLHVVWYVPRPDAASVPAPALDRYFDGPVEVATMRSAWDDPDALWIGIKAGYNTVNHGHLDLGAFELDALGVRWSSELGSDDYNMPGYWSGRQGGARWQYYRLNSFSHSILQLAGENQLVAGKSTFTLTGLNNEGPRAVVDLSSAWSNHAASVVRGARLVGGRRAVLVQDEVELREPCDVLWGMMTSATIDVASEREAVLTIGDRRLRARILSPEGMAFGVESARQEPPQKENRGYNRLVGRLTGAAGAVRVAVLLAPEWPGDGAVPTADVVPLSNW